MGEVTDLSSARPGRLASKAALCTVYVLFVYAHAMSLRTDGFRLSIAMLAVFETVMVGLVFVRRDSRDVDLTPMAVVAGLIGSFSALGFRPVTAGSEHLAGQVIQVLGVCLQLAASWSLGRSFGLVPANRGVKTGGLYRIVRHPFYFSYLFIDAGYLLNNPSGRNLTVAVVGIGFQVVRIRHEEQLLIRDPAYRRYVGSVRWHLVPGLW